MPAQVVVFDPEGSPITAEIRCGHGRDGAYIPNLSSKFGLPKLFR